MDNTSHHKTWVIFDKGTMEEASEFKSVFHNSYDDEQALQEAEEEKNIEENVSIE